jgi:hypothetical protein
VATSGGIEVAVRGLGGVDTLGRCSIPSRPHYPDGFGLMWIDVDLSALSFYNPSKVAALARDRARGPGDGLIGLRPFPEWRLVLWQWF